MTNKINFSEIFDQVQMDPEAKSVFIKMPRDEQLLAILGMQAWMRSEQANLTKRVIDLERDVRGMRKADSKYYREDDNKLSTSEKIINVLTKRFDFWLDIIKGTLQYVITFIIMALLYLSFGGKLPTP